MRRRVAILGATGLVGRTMLSLLEERRFPVETPRLLASDRPTERHLAFNGRSLPVEAVEADAFRGIDIALFAVDAAVSRRWADVAREAGAHVIDNSSAFRYDEGVPLVVPEVNGRVLGSRPPLIANPNCTTIGLVMALAPIARVADLERVVVSTYQAVSGAGAEALDELERGVRAGLEGSPPRGRDGGPPFAFNVIPHIDRFEEGGYTFEELKIVRESRKILGLPTLRITATAVRVPVRVGHCSAVNVALRSHLSPDEARALWARFPGVEVVDDPARGLYPTPLEAAGRDAVLVGRVRTDPSQPHGLEFFVASDNLRKGAALNAVQIAESLDHDGGGIR